MAIKVTIPCGYKKDIHAYDKDGNPVTYEVEAVDPASGGGNGGDDPGGHGGHGGPAVDGTPDEDNYGDDPEPVQLPAVGDPVAANVVVMDEYSIVHKGFPYSDIYVNQRLFAQLPAGISRDAVAWKYEGGQHGRRTITLPEGVGELPDAGMMFVIGMEMPGTP